MPPLAIKLSGEPYNYYVSDSQRAVQIPIPPGERVHAFGKISYVTGLIENKAYIYLDGGLTTGDNETQITHQAIAEIDLSTWR